MERKTILAAKSDVPVEPAQCKCLESAVHSVLIK